jgi:DNA-binding transcriptional ArsR family regulator
MTTSVQGGTVALLDDLEQVAALAHPLRVAILDALRTPDSAAGAARAIGETRQKVNHHVKALLDAGLLRSVGERRNGNFVEQLYESVASAFMVSPRLACTGQQRTAALERQLPLEHLVHVGERIQRDAIGLLDRAAFEGDDVPSASVEAEVRFPDDGARAAFVQDHLAALQTLLKRHGARRGDAFRVALAIYPDRSA